MRRITSTQFLLLLFLCMQLLAANGHTELFLPQPIMWQDMVKTTASYPGAGGSTLLRSSATSASPAWDGDAISTEILPGDCWVEFRFDQAKRVAIGLAPANADRNRDSLTFSIAADTAGNFTIREAGTAVTTAAPFVTTDIFRIERIGTAIVYKRNGTEIAVNRSTFPQPSAQGVLLVDTSFVDVSGSLSLCRYAASTLPEDVLWFRMTPSECAAAYTSGGAGSKLTKTGAVAGYNANAIGSKAFQGDGLLRFCFGQNNKTVAIGLGDPLNTSADYTQIKFAIVAEGSAVSVREGGAVKYIFSGAYTTSDVFTISRSGSVLSYLKNGVVFYTSAAASEGLLSVNCTLSSLSASVTNCQVEGYPLSEVVTCINSVLATVNYKGSGTEIVKTGTTQGWNAGGYTQQFISGYNATTSPMAVGSGSLSFSFGQNNGKAAVGLTTTRSTSVISTFSSINYALVGDVAGVVRIYESGVEVTGVSFGTYTAQDRFEIRRLNGNIEYLKNGYLLRSVPAVSGALTGVASLYDVGTKVTGMNFYSGTEDVIWRRATNSTPQVSLPGGGSDLTRDSSAAAWTADALGTRLLRGDGYVQWRFGQTGKDMMLGLSPSDKGNGNADLQYAIYGNGSVGVLKIFESGTSVGQFGAYTVSDTFRIRRVGSTIYYYKLDANGNEGTPLRTVTGVPAGPLVVDCALSSPASTLLECRVHCEDSDSDGLSDRWENMEFGGTSDPTGANFIGDTDEVDNLHEFYNGSSPHEFDYAGVPMITKTLGEGQSGPAASIFTLPLRVLVTNGVGTPLSNAPVQFSVGTSNAQVVNASGVFSPSLEVFTNGSGVAEVGFYSQRQSGLVSITATAGTGAYMVQTSFTETVTVAPTTAGMRL